MFEMDFEELNFKDCSNHLQNPNMSLWDFLLIYYLRSKSLKKKLPIKSGILDTETAYVQISLVKWKQTCFKNRIPDFPFYVKGRMSVCIYMYEMQKKLSEYFCNL